MLAELQNNTEDYIVQIEQELTRLKVSNKDLRKNNRILLESLSKLQSRISVQRKAIRVLLDEYKQKSKDTYDSDGTYLIYEEIIDKLQDVLLEQ